jgi:hypothetical protein
MGVDDYLYSGAWCFEWAEQIRIWFPRVIRIREQADGKRVLELS